MTMRSSAGRLIAAGSFFAKLAIHSPPAGGRAMRELAASVLDLQFSLRSPLPILPQHFEGHLNQHPVTMPPASLLCSGNQDFRGLHYLVAIAKSLGARTIFEIGTYNGLTALTLAMNLPNALVHTLDIPGHHKPILQLSASDHGNLYRAAKRVYFGTAEAGRIVQHLEDSATFDFSALEGSVDLVYVDGAHSFEYLANDSKAASRMVSASGAIIWDDYWRRVPDVPRFIDSLEKRNLYRLPGSRLVAWFSDEAVKELTGVTTGSALDVYGRN
jgi:hypothetical protein